MVFVEGFVAATGAEMAGIVFDGVIVLPLPIRPRRGRCTKPLELSRQHHAATRLDVSKAKLNIQL
jgi:hypothetical protein